VASKRRLPRRKAVTVCITAIADDEDAIVSCVDTRVDTLITSFDPLVGHKMSGACGWTVLTAGTFSQVESLVDSFHAELQNTQDHDPPSIERCLESALRVEMPRFGAAKYLTPFGIDMKTFLESAPTTGSKLKKFTEERWNELSRLILDYSDQYDAELIVSGWGPTQEDSSRRGGACIFGVSRDGVLRHSNVGFHACGSGGTVAHSILSAFGQEPRMTLAETIYHTACAKFMAEKAHGVGEGTLMRVGLRLAESKDKWKGYFIQPNEIDQLRELCRNYVEPTIPAEAEDVITQMLGNRGKLRVTQDYMTRRVQGSIEQTKQSGDQRLEPER
jgi:hypothetical protein